MSRIHIMDTGGTEIFVRTLSKAEGLRVIFSEEEDAQPYTDPINKIIHVAKPRWYWKEEQYNCWLGAVCHELGHHRGKNADIMKYFTDKKINTKSIYGKIVNLLMDWVDDFQWRGYPGAHNAVQAVQVRCASRAIPMLMDRPPTTEEDVLLCKVFSWIYSRRAETYQRELMPAAMEWTRLVPHDLHAYNSDLIELLAIQDGPSIEELAKKIVPESMQDEEQEEQEGDDGEGEGGDGKQSEEEGDSDSKECEGKPAETSENTVSYKDILMSHDHSNMGKPAKTTIVYDHVWARTYVPFGTYKEINLEEVCK